ALGALDAAVGNRHADFPILAVGVGAAANAAGSGLDGNAAAAGQAQRLDLDVLVAVVFRLGLRRGRLRRGQRADVVGGLDLDWCGAGAGFGNWSSLGGLGA